MNRLCFVLLLAAMPFSVFAGRELVGTTGLNFLKISPMAGAAAMADAYTAVSEGSYGMYYNPAGISYILSSELQISHVSWFKEMNAQNISLITPFSPVESAKFGLSLQIFDAGLIDETSALPSYDTPYLNSGINYDSFVIKKVHPYSSSFAAAYAMSIREFLSAGIRLKYSTENIGTLSGSSICADTGFLYKSEINGHLVGFGITLSNLGSALKIRDEGFIPPKIVDIGASDKFRAGHGELLLAAQYTIHVDYDFLYMLGAEYRVFDILFLRLGYMLGGFNRFNAGAGVRLEQGEINYSFSDIAGLGASHRISLLYSWGTPPCFISVNPVVFSPNKDGVLDTVEITPKFKYAEKVRSAYISIYKKGGKQALGTIPVDVTQAGTNIFTGKIAGTLLPDAEYEAELTAEYRNGKSISRREVFEVDNTPPETYAEASPKLLKPEGESLLIPATFSLLAKDKNGIVNWQLVIWDRDKKVFFSTGGSGTPPAEYIWDGKGNDGTYVRTGDIYYYSLISRDKLGNKSQSETKSQVVLLKEIKLTFSSDALFEQGKANVRITAYEVLKSIRPVIKQYPESEILIAGYTDNAEGMDNLALSKARAEAVKFFMVNILGVEEKMIQTAGFGEKYPVADNTTPEGRIKNRRVEITIKSTVYK